MINVCENPACPLPNGVFTTARRKRRFCGRTCSNAHHGVQRASALVTPKTIVWACGGGIDSTAIALMICEGILPKPDIAIMMDNGYERRATMTFVHHELVPRLAAAGVTLNVVDSAQYGADLSCIDRKGMVRIPAFRTRADGSIIKLRTWCNAEWKQKPCKRWLRSQGVTHAIHWVGISADEQSRIRPSKNHRKVNAYPLVEQGWSRERCIHELGLHGWPLPPRSSCLMCPSQSDQQWMAVKSVPEDWAKALACESELQMAHPDTWLHKSCMPLAVALEKARGGGAK